jgi:hypothetical protein
MILQPVAGGGGGALAFLRWDIELLGAKNGANPVFTTPDKFDPDYFVVYWNGRRLFVGDDYLVSESGGPGTGYDTITLLWTKLLPRAADRVTADYLRAA